MADMEMIKFEAAVEKLCADLEVDLAKALKQEQDAIEQRTKKLTKDILALPWPKDCSADEYLQAPNRIREIFKDEAEDVWDMVGADINAKVDETSLKLTIDGFVMFGLFANLGL